MKPGWPHLLGAAVGLLAAIVVIEARSRLAADRHEAPILSECSGALAELVIHANKDDPSPLPVYRDFLPHLPADVVVHVVCPDQESFDALKAFVGDVSCVLRPLITHHPMTVWSRDRWMALAPADAASPAVLLAPREETAAESWEARAGDSRIAIDLAAALQPDVVARRIPLCFDAGDLLADDQNVFVIPTLAGKNLGVSISSVDQMKAMLSELLHRRVIVLGRAPSHHAGMYMMAAGNRTMIVGDPRLGRAFLADDLPPLPGGADLSEKTQADFDAVAAQVAAEGYRVVRIPTLLSPDERTYLTYVNVMTDHRAGRDIVYMPVYTGAAAMNEAAAEVWKSLGYDVVPVNCTSSYTHFGNLHCLVNVLRRQ